MAKILCCVQKLSSLLNPTNPSAVCFSVNGPQILPMIKLKIAATMIASRKFCALVSHSMPTAQMKIMTANAIAPTIRISFSPLSMIFALNSSVKYTFNREKRNKKTNKKKRCVIFRCARFGNEMRISNV